MLYSKAPDKGNTAMPTDLTTSSKPVPATAMDRGRRFTGRHMLLIMLAFFGTVVGVNLTLAYFATGSWTGLVVKNSYVASQEFNSRHAARESAESVGWQLAATVESGYLVVRLRDAAGEPLDGVTVAIDAGRPVHEGADRMLSAAPEAPGVYRTGEPLPAGQWNLTIDLSRRIDGKTDRLTRFVRLHVPAPVAQ